MNNAMFTAPKSYTDPFQQKGCSVI